MADTVLFATRNHDKLTKATGETYASFRARVAAANSGFNGFPFAIPDLESGSAGYKNAYEVTLSQAIELFWRVKNFKVSGSGSLGCSFTFDRPGEDGPHTSTATAGMTIADEEINFGRVKKTSISPTPSTLDPYLASREIDLPMSPASPTTSVLGGTAIAYNKQEQITNNYDYSAGSTTPVFQLTLISDYGEYASPSHPDPLTPHTNNHQATASVTLEKIPIFTKQTDDFDPDSPNPTGKPLYIDLGWLDSFFKVVLQSDYFPTISGQISIGPTRSTSTDAGSWKWNLMFDTYYVAFYSGESDLGEVGSLVFTLGGEDITIPLYATSSINGAYFEYVPNYYVPSSWTDIAVALSGTPSLDLTCSPSEFYPYKNSAGDPVWDKDTGDLIAGVS